MRKYLIYILLAYIVLYTRPCIAQIQSIPGLELMISADSVHLSGGSFVDTIYDVSANGRHAFQTSATNQPLLSNSLLNGHKTIKFDAVDDYLTLPTVDYKTAIIVARLDESPSTNYRGLIGGLSSSYSVGGYLLNSFSGTQDMAMGSSFTFFTMANKNGLPTTPFGNFTPINQFWIGSFVFTINRAQVAEIGRIDAGSSAGRYWNGDISEIIVFNRDLLPAELLTVENYLNAKYAPGISLPADVNSSNSFCSTTISAVNPNNNDYSYLWSTGAVTPTISVNQSGKYWLRATNIFGKVSSDTILVTYPQYNLLTDSAMCMGETIQWNTGLAKDDFTFLWQDNTTTDSTFSITQAGPYYVTISDGFGCSITTTTVNVTTDNFPVTASLGNDTSLCSGNHIALRYGLAPGLTYTWSTGSNTPSITITATGQYSVTVTNTNNCIATDTINVTIVGLAPVADFLFSKTCKNNQTQFTDQSVTSNTIVSYAWDFGDPSSGSNTSALNNPFHTFSDTGTFAVNLTVKTNVGCEGSIQKNIHIAPTPTLNFNFGIPCQNDSTAFTSTAGSPPYPIQSYAWNFGDPASGIYNSASSQNPKHLFSNQLSYAVKLIATNSAGCKDSISKNVLVRGQVKAGFTYGPACMNSPTLFQDASIVPAPTGSHSRLWSFSTPSNTLSGLNVNYTYTNSGVYTVSLTVTGTNGCISKTSKMVSVFIKPVISFTVPTICAKDTVTILNSTTSGSGIITSYNWKLNTTFMSAIQNPTLSITTAGNYAVSLTVKNSMQCRDSVTVPVTVFPLPAVDFSTNPPVYLYKDSSVIFMPTPTNGVMYNWLIDHTSSASPSPVYVFDSTGTYPVTLTMKDANGCKNSKTKNIQILDSYLDLAITDISTSINQNNFLETKVSLINLGSIPVHAFEIKKSVLNASTLNEQWTGTLNPGTFYQYTFTSKELLLNPADRRIVCATIESVNFRNDDNPNNNNKCISFNHSSVEVFDPYPNPTETHLTIPVSVTKAQSTELELTDALGQLVMSQTTELNEGLNYLSINSSNLTGGCYVIKLTIDGATYIKKIIKQ